MAAQPLVTAVVVTYNRRQMLEQCLQALCGQTRLPDGVIVVDNASTDGTDALFAEGGAWGREARGDTAPDTGSSTPIDYLRLDENRGGAGGFKEGLRRATDAGADWVWIMDDDVVPDPEALDALLQAIDYLQGQEIKPSFLASHVSGADGEVMNVPNVSAHRSANGYPDWLEHLPSGLVRISSATFVSLLVNADAVRQVGLPISDYFLWGDDIEYTKRLTAYYGPAFACGTSHVAHLRTDARPIDIVSEQNPQRIANHRRRIRNDLINVGYYDGQLKAARRIGHYLLESARILASRDAHKAIKARAIRQGVSDYLMHRYDLEDLGKLRKSAMVRH